MPFTWLTCETDTRVRYMTFDIVVDYRIVLKPHRKTNKTIQYKKKNLLFDSSDDVGLVGKP